MNRWINTHLCRPGGITALLMAASIRSNTPLTAPSSDGSTPLTWTVHLQVGRRFALDCRIVDIVWHYSARSERGSQAILPGQKLLSRNEDCSIWPPRI